MDLSKIPNRLRGEPYFCLMKLEKKPGKDKKDKVPYRTNAQEQTLQTLNISQALRM